MTYGREKKLIQMQLGILTTKQAGSYAYDIVFRVIWVYMYTSMSLHI